MSTEDTVKSLGAAFAFVGVAWLSDVISTGLASLQLQAFTAFFGGPQVLVTIIAAAALAVIDVLFGAGILEKIAGGFVVFLSMQALLSLLTLCVFYAIVLASPKGTYSVSDCLIAAGVCLLEAAPFLSTFTFWGTFAIYLRRQEISKVTGKISSAVGLGEVGGGKGGFLGKIGKITGGKRVGATTTA